MTCRAILIIIISLIPFFSIGQDSTNVNAQQFLKKLEKRGASLQGQPFPSFMLMLGEKKVSNEIFLNKISLVNFWFESCRPCLLEFKGFNLLYDKLRKDKEFQFISFTFENEEAIKNVRKKYNLKFKIISVSYQEFIRLNESFGCPVNAIVDKEGKIKYWKSGGKTSESDAIDYIFKTIYPLLLEELHH